MFCKKCGASLTENDQFCKNCGEKVVNEINNNSNMNNNSNGNDFSSEPIISMTPMEVNNVSSIDNSSNDTPVMVNDNISSGVNSSNMNSMNSNSNMNNNVNNNVNTSNNSNNAKPGNLKTVLIIAGVVVALIIVFLIGFFNGKSTENGGEHTKNGGSGSSGGESATPVSNTATYKVSFGGFTFEFPDTLVYEIQNNSLLFGTDTWGASLMLQQGDFNTLKSKRSKMKSNIETAGYTAKNAELKTINKREYITMEISYGGQNAIYVYTKGTNSYIFGAVLYNIDNTFDYEPINDFTSIFDSAVYSGSSMSIKSNSKFDASKGIESLLK